jgi:predicted DNA-binding transcriptional regulator AlpA
MVRNSAAVVPIRQEITDETPVAMLTLGQLRAAWCADFEPMLVDHVEPSEKPKRKSHPENLLDREELAERLGVSVRSVDTLRQKKDFPELQLLESPRFVWADVLAFLRSSK